MSASLISTSWNKELISYMLSIIPSTTSNLLEFGCGKGDLAHQLLPSLSEVQYIGVDNNEELIAEGLNQAHHTSLDSRIRLELIRNEEWPVDDHSVDIVLSLLRLQHEPNLKVLLRDQIKRVLKSGGKILALEPDNLGQRFYFDGVLEEINHKFHRLCLKARVHRQPADIALGPRLPKVLQKYGFSEVTMRLHPIGVTRYEPVKLFCDRIKKIAQQTASLSGLNEEIGEFQDLIEAIRRFQFTGLPKRFGHSSHLVPAFCVVGTYLNTK